VKKGETAVNQRKNACSKTTLDIFSQSKYDNTMPLDEITVN
jgi:hypothetical protein